MSISPYNRLVPVPFVLLVLALFLIALIVLLAAARSIDVAEGNAQVSVPVLQRTEGKSKAESSKRRGPLTQLPRQPKRQATLIVE
jgi:hypothetical protein